MVQTFYRDDGIKEVTGSPNTLNSFATYEDGEYPIKSVGFQAKLQLTGYGLLYVDVGYTLWLADGSVIAKGGKHMLFGDEGDVEKLSNYFVDI